MNYPWASGDQVKESRPRVWVPHTSNLRIKLDPSRGCGVRVERWSLLVDYKCPGYKSLRWELCG